MNIKRFCMNKTVSITDTIKRIILECGYEINSIYSLFHL